MKRKEKRRKGERRKEGKAREGKGSFGGWGRGVVVEEEERGEGRWERGERRDGMEWRGFCLLQGVMEEEKVSVGEWVGLDHRFRSQGVYSTLKGTMGDLATPWGVRAPSK